MWDALRFRLFIGKNKNWIWKGTPDCPGRSVSFIETRTQIEKFNLKRWLRRFVEEQVLWEIRFPYIAIEKGKQKNGIVTYQQRLGEPYVRVFGVFSNRFTPTKEHPLRVFITHEEERSTVGKKVNLTFLNQLPAALAREQHTYYFDENGVLWRQRKSDFQSNKTGKWTVSLESTELIAES